MNVVQCIICGSNRYGNPNLLDFHSVHDECRENLERRNRSLPNEIAQAQASLSAAKQELLNLGVKISAFLIKHLLRVNTSEYLRYQEARENIRANISRLEDKIDLLIGYQQAVKADLTRIYDYYPFQYPPDWQERSYAIKLKRGRKCSSCRKQIKGDAHLHHKKPVSQGGNHTESNLQVLCTRCHSKKHKGIDFNHQSSNGYRVSSNLDVQIETIKKAIKNGSVIEFDYKKSGARKYSKREVRPRELIQVARRHTSGATLCVRGFCELTDVTQHSATWAKFQ